MDSEKDVSIKGVIRRMIFSKIWESKQVSRLKPLAVILYIGTITISDDDGRFNADSQILKAKIFPRRKSVSPKMIDAMKKSIEKEQLISFYRAGDEEYGCHPNWDKYQSLRGDRRKISKIPPPPNNQLSANCQPDDNQATPQPNTTEPNPSQDNITEDKISDFRKSYGSMDQKPYKPRIPAEGYKPNNYNEGKCLEIAKEVGEVYMDYLLSVEKMTGGFNIIESAFGEYREAKSALDEKEEKIGSKPALLNSFIKKRINKK